jgi:hypothetical protein
VIGQFEFIAVREMQTRSACNSFLTQQHHNAVLRSEYTANPCCQCNVLIADVYDKILLHRRTILPSGKTGMEPPGTNLAVASFAMGLHFFRKHKHHSHLLTNSKHI